MRAQSLLPLSSTQAAFQQLAHPQRVFQQQYLQSQQYDQQQHMQFTSNSIYSSPQQQQQEQRKRPYKDDHSQSEIPHSPYHQVHISNPPHSSYYVLSPTSVQQQPMAIAPYFHQSPTAHNTTQAIIPIQVQSQFQPTPTFQIMPPTLQRDLSGSTLASVEQPSHLLPTLPSSDHQPVTSSATLHKLTKEAAAKATSIRKKKRLKLSTRLALRVPVLRMVEAMLGANSIETFHLECY